MNAATLTEGHTKIPGQVVSLPAPADALLLPQDGQPRARPRYLRAVTAVVEDAAVLVLAVLLIAVVVYIVGTPIALCIRAIMAIARLVF